MVHLPRRDLVNPLEVETHHVWSQCVQRAWLMGVDPLTGHDYSHRKHWIESLTEYLASVFAVDVGCPHLLSNHLHNVLRSRPDKAAEWSDEEVIWRWKMAWPTYCDGQWVCEPTDEAIKEQLLRGPERVAQVRRNLSNISWWMARLKEPVAKMANAEMGRKGHYWDGRYGNRKLETEEETLTAFLYDDLQQVRAGIVDSVEASDYSGIQRQIRAHAEQAVQDFFGPLADQRREEEVERMEVVYANCFLAPINDTSPLLTEPSSEPLPSELVLPLGYITSRERGVNPPDEAAETASESPASEALTDETHATPATEPELESDPDQQPDAALGQAAVQRRPGKAIHRRLRARQQRRASRQSILNIPWPQYYELLKRAEARCLAQRAETPPPGPADAAEPGIPGAARPDSTPSTWQAELRQFTAELRQLAVELPQHLARWLSPAKARGDP